MSLHWAEVVGWYGSMCTRIECDWSAYHPLAGNMMNVVAGTPTYGHPDVVLRGPQDVWPLLQTVIAPYGTEALNCSELQDALAAPRTIVVSLVCTLNSRTRAIVREAVESPDWPFRKDPRVIVRVETDLWKTLDEFSDGALLSLYRRSVYCLVPPGNLVDLTYRFYDAVRFGCLPVVLMQRPLVVAAPFAALGVDYRSFAHFAHLDQPEDVARVLKKLFAEAADPAAVEKRRANLLANAPLLFFEHVNCTPMAGAGELLTAELAIRQQALGHARFVGAPTL
eukprot:gnl/TRDRNA2_/TRDRNA2_166110_c0_seq2.p1 gnl/TRDRNA2_/TRDRNA2_166110_c0~~gnl/TRDRNA2_/TRDRNA2_166110_c0_seq2.p1  ORF type:complete len:281 (-),score=36.37 gnl/TRDRNA2_/TRDRNA2_166110_c0_seq2:10-852(-)